MIDIITRSYKKHYVNMAHAASKTHARVKATRNVGKKGTPTHPQSSMTHYGSSRSPYEITKSVPDFSQKSKKEF